MDNLQQAESVGDRTSPLEENTWICGEQILSNALGSGSGGGGAYVSPIGCASLLGNCQLKQEVK